MSFPAPKGRSRRFGLDRPVQGSPTLGVHDPSIAEQRLPDPVAADVFETVVDPFAIESSIEFRSEVPTQERRDGTSIGRMWSNYSAIAVMGDVAS
ncbi:MAG: hypothetical protein HKN46_06085 [Acidimicrobiia bacterium]|nr:hypothetical protein [Acidimicrobiia bacterium]